MLINNRRCVKVTKEFTFDSAHHLNDYDGPCANVHGHTYKLQIAVFGPVNDNGFVLDFSDLKDIVKENIINVLDHKDLNQVLTFNPTAENMVLWIYDTLNLILDSTLTLTSVTLWETPTSFAEYKVGGF